MNVCAKKRIIVVYIVTYFTDVAGGRLSTLVVVELVANATVHHDARLIAVVVVGLVVAPPCIAAFNHQHKSLHRTVHKTLDVHGDP